MGSIKPETTIKQRMSDALDAFKIRYGREIGNEEYTKENLRLKWRVTISGPTRFCCGQARYEGSEGTWLCWMNYAGDAISGKPLKKDDTVPSFGLYEELVLVDDMSDKELYQELIGEQKELIFLTASNLTITIARTPSVDLQWGITWRDRQEKIIHRTHYHTFEEIRSGESINLSNFRIAKIYKYDEE